MLHVGDGETHEPGGQKDVSQGHSGAFAKHAHLDTLSIWDI